MATKKTVPKKPKKTKKEKALDILLRATIAWDVAPKGTVEFGVLDKLADEIIEL